MKNTLYSLKQNFSQKRCCHLIFYISLMSDVKEIAWCLIFAPTFHLLQYVVLVEVKNEVGKKSILIAFSASCEYSSMSQESEQGS